MTRVDAVGRLPSRIAFLGFGLIGGSIAMALLDAGYRGELVAWTPSGTGPHEGLTRGILDQAVRALEAATKNAGLIVLAGPPLAIVDLLEKLPVYGKDPWSPPEEDRRPDEPTITDVGSTKAQIVDMAGALGMPFVGGHPMAGRETTGVPNATADLFVGRPWVVSAESDARPIDLERVEALAVATGARPIRMDPVEHDVVVAAISHLPLVLAAALVESVISPNEGPRVWPSAKELVASGWRDMTRLARGDPAMGAGILATNGGPVAARLRAFRDVLEGWIELLDPAIGGGDTVWIQQHLQEIREALQGETE